MSLLRSNLQRPPVQPTAQTPMPQSVCSLTQAKAPAPSQPDSQHQTKFEVQQETPGAPAQVSMPNFQAECSVTATHQVTAAQDGASPASSTPNSSKPVVQHPKPFPLPLIRSKTGRIILPSSLKPRKLRRPVQPWFNRWVRLSSFVCMIRFQHIYFPLFSQLVKASIHLWSWNPSRKERRVKIAL